MADTNDNAAPWGDDFDADRAWALVQNLRTEKEALKTERDTLKADLQASSTAKGDSADAIAAAEKRAKDAEKALYVERALRKHPTLEDFAEFLTGDSEEEILQKAERLASIGAKSDEEPGDAHENSGEQESTEQIAPDAQDGDQDDENEGLPGKPTPDLKPGHGGETPPVFDPVAIAQSARR